MKAFGFHRDFAERGFRPLVTLVTVCLVSIAASGVLAGEQAASTQPSSGARPNVVIFLADDAGWGDYSFSGNTMLSTPSIDSIAKSGVSFDRFFVCPVCAPTRAEFLTGRYHPRGGVSGVSTGFERLDLQERTLADAFKAAGYATGCFGKWHNGSQWPYHPMARGFDTYFGHTSGHWGEYVNAPLEDEGVMVRTNGYIVDVCTDRALQFIDEHRNAPFLCYVPFTTPHSPWSVPEEDWQRFKDKKLTQSATDPQKEKAEETRCVLAMMENQDRNVGRILKKLEEYSLRDNTIVLYFSDNGPNTARWTGGMKGQKGTTDEGGILSVCYLSWPAGIPAGRTVTQIAGAIDLLPTLTTLAGIPRVGERPLDGKDLTPLIHDPESLWPDRTLFTTWAGKITARTQRFRLDDQGRLFDMQSDPGQTVAVNDKHADVADSLKQQVIAWRSEVLKESDHEPKPRRNQNASMDPRPFPVGYREFPITILPARDGVPSGQVRRSSPAPNCSYFVNWASTDDRMTWNISVATTGTYEVSVDYTCPIADAGAKVELAFSGSSLRATVKEGWDPPLYDNQDTLPRPHGESSMKEFRTMSLGRMKLEQGAGELTLRAIRIPGKTVMDVRRLTLTLLPETEG